VKLNHDPYTAVMVRMKALNQEMYPLADYFDQQSTRTPSR
jgi:hypothetical protein